jgi:ketosteroid isomerase-like protein
MGRGAILPATMTPVEVAFAEAWQAFQKAFASGNDPAAKIALQRWVSAWDDCVREGSLDVFDVAYHPDLRARSHMALPIGMRKANGLEEFRAGALNIPDVAQHFRFEITGYERNGPRFVGSGVIRTAGRYSGIPFRLPMAVLWSCRAGKIATVDAYATKRGALSALRTEAGD